MNDFAILKQLGGLSASIRTEINKILPGVPEPTSPHFAELVEKIPQWTRTLQAIQKQIAPRLKSRTHFNEMMLNKNRFGPSSYSAKQRHKSHAANITRVSDALAQVLSEIALLSEIFYKGDSPETRILKALAEAGSQLTTQSDAGVIDLSTAPASHELTAVIEQARPLLPQGSQQLGGPNASGTIILLFTLFAMIKHQLTQKT